MVGKIDFGYTGRAANEYGWWNVVNGKSSILIIERDRTGGFIPPVFVVQS